MNAEIRRLLDDVLYENEGEGLGGATLMRCRLCHKGWQYGSTWVQARHHTGANCPGERLEALFSLAAPAVPAPHHEEKNDDDQSRVDLQSLSQGQDLPRKPQPDGSQRLRHAHRETLEVFKHIEGTVSPQEAAKQAANYMLEVLLAAAEVAGVD